jgi:lysyl-tRNA synthetase class 2
LLGLIVSFLFIRTSTRMIRAKVSWWPGNVSAGSVHLHHEFFGVITMLVCGILAFWFDTSGPWRNLLALGFGIGAGLVLDEFALLLHLKDVYWTNEGRSSLTAVILATAATMVVLLGVIPFGIGEASNNEGSDRWSIVSTVLINLVCTVITAFKGKTWLALLSVVFPLAGLIGAIRLARPASPWSRWRYSSRPKKAERAAEREATWARRRRATYNAIAGAPGKSTASNRS